MSKRAFLTGASGQDGAWLAQLLLHKGYEVYGGVRRSASGSLWRLEELGIKDKVNLVPFELHELPRMIEVLRDVKPDEVYNLAAQSYVAESWRSPLTTADVTGMGALRLIEACRSVCPDVRYYQAGSSEQYGNSWCPKEGYNETSIMEPRSPYGYSKLFAYWAVRNARESFGMHASTGILFNHEGVFRGLEFVTRKISDGVARIASGEREYVLRLGNLDAKRDWGAASDYCVSCEVPILTPVGWKFVDEVNEGDELINFDVGASRLSRDYIKRKIEIKHEGTWVVLSGRGVYLRCTPNHRIFYQQKSKRSKGGWSNWKVCTAIEYHAKMGGLKDSTKYDYRLPHFHDYDAADFEIKDEEIRLVGYLLTEGNEVGRKKRHGAGYAISVSQSLWKNPGVSKRMESDLVALGLQFRQDIRNDGVAQWALNAESSREVRSRLFTGVSIREMPQWCYSLSQRQAGILFSTMMDCDGCWGSMEYVSIDKKLATDFQSIAHLAGYRTSTIHKRPDSYSVGVIVPRKKYTYVTDTRVEKTEEVDAWCVETGNGTIVTRDNDRITISGNCEAMWLMLQQDKPDDYVIATGETHSVREFVDAAFEAVGIEGEWIGSGVSEFLLVKDRARFGYDCRKLVEIDPQFYRPAELDVLLGDASKARRVLGWEPQTSFKQLVQLMVTKDVWRREHGKKE